MSSLFAALESFPHSGEIFSLASALIWAAAVILFRVSGKNVHPLGLNLFKNLFALSIIPAVLLIFRKPIFPAATGEQYGFLLLSGLLGIAVSDTLFFLTLNILGAGLTAIVDCFYSPFIILFSYLFLDERLNVWQLTGVVFIIAAVLTIARKGRGENGRIPRADLIRGIGAGILAMFFVSVSIVMIKPLLPSLDIFWATGVRLAGGTLGLLVVIPFHPRRRAILKPLFSPLNWKAMVPASFLGSFLSLLFWLGGMKHTFASIAAILNQMSTIFIFILAAIFLKEKATPWKIASVVLAFIGAFLASRPF